jgi:hypothetical protein
MSDVIWVAAIAATPATIGVLLSAWNNRKIAVVHEAVNGGLAAAKAEIVKLEEEIARLKA